VPASILSSDDLTESEETDFSDEETNEETEDEVSPEDLMANDKKAVLERARTHRELLGSNDEQIPTRVPWTHKGYHRSRQRTPALPTAAEDGDESISSGSDEDDELSQSEDEDEDDAEANVQDAAQISEEEDDVLDAQLFFNNLLEEDSASDEGIHSEEDSVMGHAIVEAGESSDTDTDVDMDPSDHLSMVKEGWDGQLVFSTEIHPPLGLMDLALDQQAQAMEENVHADSLANSLSTLPVTQPIVISDEEEFEYMESEAGDTTDDEIVPGGMANLPPTTVAPDATLTPARVLATLRPFPPVFPSPSPSDILAAGKTVYPWDAVSSPVQSIAATDELPPRSRSNSTHSLGSRGPRLGFFRGANFGSKRTIIGDADGKLPSPFSNLTPAAPVFRRKRRANVCIFPLCHLAPYSDILSSLTSVLSSTNEQETLMLFIHRIFPMTFLSHQAKVLILMISWMLHCCRRMSTSLQHPSAPMNLLSLVGIVYRWIFIAKLEILQQHTIHRCPSLLL
jgi:hypothetical protein